jgi:predicted hotdog family 3-hydroxylacyl-ACP dehydratase
MSSDPGIDELIPHAGRMCLLERILDWDAGSIRLAAISHRSADHPLAAHGRLRAVNLCEYGAQAMAVHGGLRARQRGEHPLPGLLVSLRDVELAVDYVDAGVPELIVAASCLTDRPDAWQYEFTVSAAGRVLARGRATVSVVRA